MRVPLRLRPLSRNLESGLHAVQPRRRRQTQSPAEAVVDTGMGLERIAAVLARQNQQLRDRSVPAAYEGGRVSLES